MAAIFEDITASTYEIADAECRETEYRSLKFATIKGFELSMNIVYHNY